MICAPLYTIRANIGLVPLGWDLTSYGLATKYISLIFIWE